MSTNSPFEQHPAKKPWLKFCGLTNAPDALLAQAYGADYLGLILVPDTSRYLDPVQAQVIVQITREHSDSPARFVGVFQNASLSEMQRLSQSLRLDAIQCHGDESPEDLNKLMLPILKTLNLSQGMTLDDLAKLAARYLALPEHKLPCFLLDLPKGDNSGDTIHERLLQIAGTPDKLRQVLGERPYWMAGKLQAKDVHTLTLHWSPFGLDVASGIEHQPGQKDPVKMRAFADSVRQAVLPQ